MRPGDKMGMYARIAKATLDKAIEYQRLGELLPVTEEGADPTTVRRMTAEVLRDLRFGRG